MAIALPAPRVAPATSATLTNSATSSFSIPAMHHGERRNVGWASVLSSDVNRSSWRLLPRPARLALVTTRTTKHPALIPHEVPAGARRRTAISARRGARRPAHVGEIPPIHAQVARPKRQRSKLTGAARPHREIRTTQTGA